jgi:AcrR family transcriptional regulator
MHETIREEIKATAWEQIARFGAPALSLRAIARQMELTAPALYRYYPDRDALVTALIVDAFSSFSQALNDAYHAHPQDDLLARFTAVGMAYRDWALAYPQRYHLIFGAPIEGYQPPLEQVQAAAAGSLEVLIEAIDALRQAGRLPVPDQMPFSPELGGVVAAMREMKGLSAHPYCVYLALVIWSRVHGLVSLELSGHFIPVPAEIYRLEMVALKNQLGIG